MRLLLDTHVLLWLFGSEAGTDVHCLSAAQRQGILDPDATVFVSVVSFWEIALKARTGKLRIVLPRLLANVRAAGFEELPILDAHLAALVDLPVMADHRDPFDHLLIAQAIAERLLLATRDRQAARYPVGILA